MNPIPWWDKGFATSGNFFCYQKTGFDVLSYLGISCLSGIVMHDCVYTVGNN